MLFPLTTALSLQQPSPICHPERTRVSYFTALTSTAYVVLPKENRTQLTEAATLDRQTGEAEGSAVLRIFSWKCFRSILAGNAEAELLCFDRVLPLCFCKQAGLFGHLLRFCCFSQPLISPA
jgi:hypothetical protein